VRKLSFERPSQVDDVDRNVLGRRANHQSYIHALCLAYRQHDARNRRPLKAFRLGGNRDSLAVPRGTSSPFFVPGQGSLTRVCVLRGPLFGQFRATFPIAVLIPQQVLGMQRDGGGSFAFRLVDSFALTRGVRSSGRVSLTSGQFLGQTQDDIPVRLG